VPYFFRSSISEKSTDEVDIYAITKTEEQLQIFRPYEEYVDDIVSKEIMSAIHNRYSILK
jgi:hypothetical protein